MKANQSKQKLNAAQYIAAVFSILAGLGGLLHGIGEVLQGNINVTGPVIHSWTTGPIAEHMGGDPGLSIISNMLLTGILCIIFSLGMILWTKFFIHNKNGGLILILLNTGMFLFGGGFGPPIMGYLAGIAGLGIHSRHSVWRKVIPPGVNRFLAGLWIWIFSVCIVNGVFLVIGHVILVVLFDYTNAGVFMNSFFLAVILLVLSLITGIAHDLDEEQRER